MLCAYSIGAPIGAGQISREKHYHPFADPQRVLLGLCYIPIKAIPFTDAEIVP